MIQDGDYIREKSSGYLHQVYLTDSEHYHTRRVFDNKTALVKVGDAVKVSKVSQLPGDPEKTERAA